MEGDEKMPADPQSVTGEVPSQMLVEFGQSSVANILDKVVLQTLQDANDGNGGALEMLEKPAFNKTQPMSRPDVRQSTILRLMYLKS